MRDPWGAADGGARGLSRRRGAATGAVRYKVEGGGDKYLDASIGSIVKVNGLEAGKFAGLLGETGEGASGKGPKVALKTGKAGVWEQRPDIALAKNAKEVAKAPGYVLGGLAVHRELKDGKPDASGKWVVTHTGTGANLPGKSSAKRRPP